MRVGHRHNHFLPTTLWMIWNQLPESGSVQEKNFAFFSLIFHILFFFISTYSRDIYVNLGVTIWLMFLSHKIRKTIIYYHTILSLTGYSTNIESIKIILDRTLCSHQFLRLFNMLLVIGLNCTISSLHLPPPRAFTQTISGLRLCTCYFLRQWLHFEQCYANCVVWTFFLGILFWLVNEFIWSGKKRN